MLTVVFAAMLFPSAVEAQTPAGTLPGMPGGSLDSLPDVPAGTAAVRGRVIREGESVGIGDIPVVLYAMPPDGIPGIRGTVTDEAGAFAFESIANDPATVYLIGARYAEIPFGLRFSFEAGELERRIDLPVSDTLADASGAEVGEVQIELEQGCLDLTVRESHQLDNPGAHTIYIPEADRAGSEPILRVTLPANASGLQFDPTVDLRQDGDALSFWGPLRPGQQTVEFSYQIPGRDEGFEMSHSFPSGARPLVLVNRPGGPRLTRSGPDDARSKADEARSTIDSARSGGDDTALRPGDSIALRVELAEANDAAERISALDARIWLELDGAALTVEEQFTLTVEGDAPLLASGGAPLLCFALPDGADDLRFSSEILATGLSRDPSGALALRGPLAAGETKVALRFLLPIERSDPLFSQVMPFDVSLLSVLIADTGLVVETSRLHRKRPMRTPDRSYLHLEAFEIPAGEPVELRLRPLEARTRLRKPAATGVALAAAALALGFLIAPLRRAGSESSVPPSAASRAADQRASVLTAIHGLDEDFEIGKLSETDYREMRQTLRAEAVDLLRTERAALAAAADPGRDADRATDLTTKSCPRCNAEAEANARFCSQCGAPLEANQGGASQADANEGDANQAGADQAGADQADVNQADTNQATDEAPRA
jgi:hypothetical protein